MRKGRRDAASLPRAHRDFYHEVSRFLPSERVIIDPLRALAYGTDASFYRLVPKIVLQVRSAAEVQALLAVADRLAVPVTFRAAGTSLSGQAVTDSVLVSIGGGFRRAEVKDGGERIVLEPGVIGGEANATLARYGRKIGPDPASIQACMVGGIAANNASGMCCGTSQNSYQTVESMKLVLADGCLLDTAQPKSRRRYAESHPLVISGLAAVRDEIAADPALAARIRHKFRIKNTTGYGLNAFLDFQDPIDILTHLMVGSEGTLGFIAEITFRTVADHPHKASALAIFPDIGSAALATQRLKSGPVSAVELMDRASLRSVEAKAGMPPQLQGLPGDASALLIEVRAGDPAGLAAQVEQVGRLLEPIALLFPLAFTDVKAEFEKLWDVRRGLFPAVGAARRIGTTVVIEDVAFPVEHLAEATVELQQLMRRHGYAEGIIFGHALDGNLHFVFTQDFSAPAEVDRYQRFIEEVCTMVARKYDGSLKGEHGTGRNMAPFVEMEWGPKAYALMKRVKQLLDPRSLLNPGVLINENPRVHLENLKPLPQAHPVVDRCIECGFCEPRCPSRALTFTPRHRIVAQRELARLRASGEDPERLRRFEADYRYLGDQTCAADGLCALACPVGIDTGQMVKQLRAEARGPASRGLARRAAQNFGAAQTAVRAGLGVAAAAHAMLGTSIMNGLWRGARGLSGGRLPAWNRWMPRPAPAAPFADVANGGALSVVYFPSCLTRTLGPARGDPDQRAVFEAMLSVLSKAGCDVVFPRRLESLCCGLAFESKGFPEQADGKAKELEAELLERSEGGRVPVLCDTSPCLQRMRAKLSPQLRLYEPAELIHDLLLDRLTFQRRPETVAIHVTCSSTKMGLGEKLRAVAQACAEKVVQPADVGCCGFAGDKGFDFPELTASALSALRSGLPPECKAGYSNSRACEVGLSLHAGIPYQSIVFLVDRSTSPRLDRR